MTKRALHPYLKSLFSIKAKVALLCTCSIIIAVTFLFIYLINVYKDSITNNTEITMQSMSTAYSEQIEMLNTNLHGITNSITEINLMVGEASRGVNDVAEKNSKIVEMSNHTQAMALDNTTHANGLRKIVEKFKL